MLLHKLESLKQYLQFLHDDPAEPAALCEDILIHVTSFFREPEAFQALAERVFARILDNRPPASRFASGSWLFHGRRGVLHRHGPAGMPGRPLRQHAIQIFGTISAPCRSRRRGPVCTPRAASARSPRSACGASSSKWRELPDREIVARDVRVRAAGPGPGPSVLAPGPHQLPQRAHLHGAGAPEEGHGHLPLRSEAHRVPAAGEVGIDRRLHGPLCGGRQEHKIWSKRPGEPRRFSICPSPRIPESHGSGRRETGRPTAVRRAEGSRPDCPQSIRPGRDRRRREPAHSHFRGQSSPYLSPTPGQASLGLLRMVRPEFAVELRTALHHARKQEMAVHKEGIRIQREGHLWTFLWTWSRSRAIWESVSFWYCSRKRRRASRPAWKPRAKCRPLQRQLREDERLRQDLQATRSLSSR